MISSINSDTHDGIRDGTHAHEGIRNGKHEPDHSDGKHEPDRNNGNKAHIPSVPKRRRAAGTISTISVSWLSPPFPVSLMPYLSSRVYAILPLLGVTPAKNTTLSNRNKSNNPIFQL